MTCEKGAPFDWQKLLNDKRVLVFIHGSGGGLGYYLQNWFKSLTCQTVKLYVEQQQLVLEEEHEKRTVMPLSTWNEANLEELLQKYRIEAVVIHHLWQFPLQTVTTVLEHSNIPYYFVFHDFFAMCPQQFY